jgi:arylsulfatase A-like enzyme
VPLLVKYPHASEGRRVDVPASQVDLMPTVLDVLGFPAPQGLQGISLRQAEQQPARNLISESFPASELLPWHKRFNRIERALFGLPMKFITSTAGKREVYDLAHDPEEKQNLYNPDDAVSHDLQARTDVWIRSMAPYLRLPGTLDKTTLDRLRSLGYVGQ